MTYRAEYHRLERSWYLWNGRYEIRNEDGSLRLFLTAEAAYEWLAENGGVIMAMPRDRNMNAEQEREFQDLNDKYEVEDWEVREDGTAILEFEDGDVAEITPSGMVKWV